MSDIVYRKMELADLHEVLSIENISFPNPWTAPMFERDILYNKLAHIYVVMKDGELLGYFSYWKIVDEAHLVTIAVTPDHRQKGYGKELIIHIINECKEKKINKITLEVRETNKAGIRLYTSFGFVKTGTRMRYYDDGADAWIMDLVIGGKAAKEEAS